MGAVVQAAPLRRRSVRCGCAGCGSSHRHEALVAHWDWLLVICFHSEVHVVALEEKEPVATLAAETLLAAPASSPLGKESKCCFTRATGGATRLRHLGTPRVLAATEWHLVGQPPKGGTDEKGDKEAKRHSFRPER